jgi:hypothetical protein
MKQNRNARDLVAAAKRDLPPADLEDAVLNAIGAGAVVVAPTLASKLWLALKHAAVSKVSIGVVALGAAASGGYVVGRAQERASREPAREIVAPPTAIAFAASTASVSVEKPNARGVAHETVETATVAPVAAPNTPDETNAHVREARAATAMTTTAAIATDAPSIDEPPPERDTLAAELGAIRAARAAVLGGDARAALRDLDAYAAAHPHGALEEESLALRVRANRLAGDDASAARALADLEKRFPTSLQLAALKNH